VAGAAFLIDMNVVFEDFVVIALREALGLTKGQFPQQARGKELYLDREQRLRLKPALSWWEGGRCIFVGDAKYKRTRETAGVQHPDAYQLLAYTTATGLPTGMLIYAAGEEPQQTYTISQAGKTLDVRTLNLNQEPDDVLADVRRLATSLYARGMERANPAAEPLELAYA
jgi:5-methylcytosine-specific restriction enzyme subunit McrC